MDPHDVHALRDFLAVNYHVLHRRLARRLGCADMASECLHEAWLRLGATVNAAGVYNPDAYVYRVACNAATDGLRSLRAWTLPGGVRPAATGDDVGDPGDDIERVADAAPGPDAIAEGRSKLHAVERAFNQLPHRHRSILFALRVDDDTREDVARRHRISLRKVDTTLRQALDHCAEHAGLQVIGGVSASRRRLPSQYRCEAIAA